MTSPIKSLVKYIEKIDLQKLRYVIDNFDKLIGEYDDMKIKDLDNPNKYLSNKQTRTLLLKYVNSLNKDGRLIMSYSQRNNKGRYISDEFGLTKMRKRIRHTIAQEFNIDLDIKNCHPVLLAFLCDVNNIPCSNLKLYNANTSKFAGIKRAVVKAINNGFSDDELNDFEGEEGSILKEIKFLLINQFVAKYPDKFKEAKEKCTREKKRNPKGTFMSGLMTHLENECLQIMIKTLEGLGVEITSLAYDGLTIARTLETVNSVELFTTSCETNIKDELGIEVKIVEKPMDKVIEIPEEEMTVAPVDFKTKMYEKYRDVELPSCNLICEMLPYSSLLNVLKTPFKNEYVAFDWIVNNIDSYLKYDAMRDIVYFKQGNEITDIKRKDAIVRAPYFYINEGVKCLKYWMFLDCNDVLQLLPFYNGVEFNPNVDSKSNKINSYQGFKAQLVDNVDMNMINPILDLLKRIWCGGDEDLYDYLCNWLHQLVKKPWEKTGVAIIIQGVEGIGKSIFCDFITKFVVGEHMSNVIQGIAPLVQKHNDIVSNKILICCNETSTGDGHYASSIEALKSLITDEACSVEPKYKKRRVDKNFINLIMTTNNPLSLPMSLTDRRLFALPAKDIFENIEEKIQYFNHIDNICFNDVAGSHFYTYFYNFKRTINLRVVPTTNIKKNMAIATEPQITSFCKDLAEIILEMSERKDENSIGNEGWAFELFSEAYKIVDEEIFIHSPRIWRAYQRWATECGYTDNYKLKKNRFWVLFQEGDHGVSQCKRRVDGRQYWCILINISKFCKHYSND